MVVRSLFLVKIPLVLRATAAPTAATASLTPPAEKAAASTGFPPKVTANKAALMICDSPASPPLQVTVPPVVHPEPQQEVSLLVVVISAGHQAVVASRQAQHLSHLANTGVSQSFLSFSLVSLLLSG